MKKPKFNTSEIIKPSTIRSTTNQDHRILHVLHQILTQSTPNSQQIKPINPVNKPTQIKPRWRNQSQQTQINTIKPRSHHQWPTQSSYHHPADQKHFFITWTLAQKPTKIPEHDHHCHRKSHQTYAKTVAKIGELHCGQDQDKGSPPRSNRPPPSQLASLRRAEP